MLAAHESNSRFNFKPTDAAAGADGRGVSNYLAGASTEDNELWNSHVQVTGLMDVFGTPVLEARRLPVDADRKVEDGEIESGGGNRDR